MKRLKDLPVLSFLAGLLMCCAGCESAGPVASAEAVVPGNHTRFTILTPELIRMEWSPVDTFENQPSLVFINRSLPVPEYSATHEEGWLVIRTEALELRYRDNGERFSADNLSIQLKKLQPVISWKPGMKDTANLGGTTRTLDGVMGATDLDPGILSRDGWVIVDDTRRPLFDNSDWPWVQPRDTSDHQDLYFFGYGRDYKKSLFDFTRVAGRIPMPPRFAFGLWWSRYWAYTDEEFKQLVEEFESYGIPLDVLVIDMDWHNTFNLRWGSGRKDQAGEEFGWTGYTWDTTFFPNPPSFLTWCESRGLRTPLNLHPASGIQPHEERYPEMARAMGIDPATKKYVPFDITDKKFATNYSNIVLRPLERQGVDFWWLDWQQWGSTNIPGVTPTWWLNYVFFTNMERRDSTRPLLFHRWGGLGNHRYQIGFSGDAISVWPSLAFQPYFTATAANVGYGYWSHDIGGHMPGEVSAELYTRWIQFGIFSPILRTHTTKNPKAERRIWAYPLEYFKVMKEMVNLRYEMIPYIYTEARKAYDSGVSICRPMYYEYPESDEAYRFRDQYMFGDRMIVAPVSTPVDSLSMLAEKEIWLPEGTWYEWFSGKQLDGPSVVRRSFSFDQVPLYIKAGSIVPMQPVPDRSEGTSHPANRRVILTIAPGDSGSYTLYDDQGNSLGYQRGEYANTSIVQATEGPLQSITIGPMIGEYEGKPATRSYSLKLVGTLPPVTVTCNGVTIEQSAPDSPEGWWYDGEHVTTVLALPVFQTDRRVQVIVRYPSDGAAMRMAVDGVPGAHTRLRTAMTMINSTWPKEWSPDVLVHGVQTGNRMSLNPDRAMAELGAFQEQIAKTVAFLQTLAIDERVKRGVAAHLAEMTAR